MVHRFVNIVIFVPLAVVLIALAVANRSTVAFTLDPFNPGNPGLTVELPLFVLLFAALALGVLVGGAVTWFRQRHYRKLARQRGGEVKSMREAARPASGAALPKPNA